MAAASVGVRPTVALLWSMGFGSFLVLILAFQPAACGRSFHRTICLETLSKNCRRAIIG